MSAYELWMEDTAAMLEYEAWLEAITRGEATLEDLSADEEQLA